jgi:glycosyltransferase involved in cell wall biosynthesis
MKILLVGEYSRLHNSLKEGLLTLGHQVHIIGCGDNFKKYPVDYPIYSSWTEDFWIIRKFKNIVFTVTTLDLQKIERALRFYFLLPKLKEYDQVQLINSDPLETYPCVSRYLLEKLIKQNRKISLLICGEETPIIDYLLKNEMKYSILTPLFEDKKIKKSYTYTLKYVRPQYRRNFDFVTKKSTAMITSDLDYKIPMEKMGYATAFIPNPINTDKIKFEPVKIEGKIIIFLGINESSAIKKGTSFFEKALEIIKQKYPTQAAVIVTRSIPYQEYITSYNKAHILLDQVYGYDQGYNALEVMAKGKVVFTGAEQEFSDHYNLTERVAINALSDVDYLVRELSYLIENSEEIITISIRARNFIEKEHQYIEVAKKYLEAWNKLQN